MVLMKRVYSILLEMFKKFKSERIYCFIDFMIDSFSGKILGLGQEQSIRARKA